jgi:outer membrane protein OmpA-like peptidoglycan-associated protein
MKKPLIIPFTANYKYTGNVIENGKTLNVIQVEYDFYYQNTRENLLRGQTLLESAGFSKQTLYWDNKKGLLDHYDEEFQIQIADIYQNIYTFKGSAKAEITEFKSVNDDKTLHSLQEEVAQMELNDISITKGEKGLTISLENIQFEPDSNVLRASEKIKLEKIAQLLQNYSNDLLITGHCAERGTENARQILSEERAQSVASYLIELGLRDEYHIFTQGKGSTEPVASNETEEGRSRNRRVEIIIMD